MDPARLTRDPTTTTKTHRKFAVSSTELPPTKQPAAFSQTSLPRAVAERQGLLHSLSPRDIVFSDARPKRLPTKTTLMDTAKQAPLAYSRESAGNAVRASGLAGPVVLLAITSPPGWSRSQLWSSSSAFARACEPQQSNGFSPPAPSPAAPRRTAWVARVFLKPLELKKRP
jgi:hypothetical protein